MASRFSQHFIDSVLERISLAELISNYFPNLKLKKSSDGFVCSCPFHDDSTPSFTISMRKQLFHCFGCNVSGNAFNLIMLTKKVQFFEALQEACQFAGVSIPKVSDDYRTKNQHLEQEKCYQLLRKLVVFYQRELLKSPEAQSYLANRKIQAATIKEFQIGYAPARWNNLIEFQNPNEKNLLLKLGLLRIDRFAKESSLLRNRIIVPIHNSQTNLIGFGGRFLGDDSPKYINSPQSIIFNKKEELFALHGIRSIPHPYQDIIVTEGFFDVIALNQNGISNVVATLGTAIGREKIRKLFRLSKTIIFCLDVDEAGTKAIMETIRNIFPLLEENWQVRFMQLNGAKDPDEFLRKYGPSEFLSQKDSALSLATVWLKLQIPKTTCSLEEKHQGLINALEDLNQIKRAPIFRKLLFQELADRTRLPSQQLEDLAKNRQRRSLRQRPLRPKLNPWRNLVILLLQERENNPEIFQILKMVPQENRKIEFLRELIKAGEEGKDQDTERILERWGNRPKILNWLKACLKESDIPIKNKKKHLLDAVTRVVFQILEEEFDLLRQKKELTESEKERLLSLISILKKGH